MRSTGAEMDTSTSCGSWAAYKVSLRLRKPLFSSHELTQWISLDLYPLFSRHGTKEVHLGLCISGSDLEFSSRVYHQLHPLPGLIFPLARPPHAQFHYLIAAPPSPCLPPSPQPWEASLPASGNTYCQLLQQWVFPTLRPWTLWHFNNIQHRWYNCTTSAGLSRIGPKT